MAAVVEAVVVELYSTLDSTAKVLHAVYSPGSRRYSPSTSWLFDNLDKILGYVPPRGNGTLPDRMKELIARTAPFERALRDLRDELVHRMPGDLNVNEATGHVGYFHRGGDDGKALDIPDVFAWMEAAAVAVDEFL